MSRYNPILNPGTLRDQITWQDRAVSGQDTYGQDVWIPRDIVTCDCSVLPMQGRELEAAQQIWAEVKYKITQHYYKGLKPGMRISWYKDGEVRTLDVADIQDPTGMGQVQVVYAKDHVE